MPAEVRVGRGEVVLAREEERDVDRDAREDRLLDGRQPFFRAGDLDEEVRALRAGEQLHRGGQRALRVVGEQRRHLERHPAVDGVGPVPDRPEQIGRPGEVVEREVEEDRLARPALLEIGQDRSVVRRAVLDRLIEDRRVRGQPGHGELVDVASERPAVEQVARDVVEPDALAQIVEQRRRFHHITCLVQSPTWRWSFKSRNTGRGRALSRRAALRSPERRSTQPAGRSRRVGSRAEVARRAAGCHKWPGPYPPSENVSRHGLSGAPSVPVMPSSSSTFTVRKRSSGAEKPMLSTRFPGS